MLDTISGMSVGLVIIFIVAVVFKGVKANVDSLRTRFQFTVLNLFDWERKINVFKMIIMSLKLSFPEYLKKNVWNIAFLQLGETHHC